ncbi:hypothetical protein D2A91_13820 [Enterococcus faecalis]|nr:hypothetical protein [Enterococcus faecalis]
MSNVKGASNIFVNCSSLTTLDLSGTNAGQSSGGLSNTGIFAGCTNLKSLNLTNVKFSPDYTEAFLGDSNLSEITIDGSFGFANELSGYPDIPNNEAYTSNWINVGTGSVDNPAGTTIL